jgi:hypothetical protein
MHLCPVEIAAVVAALPVVTVVLTKIRAFVRGFRARRTA